MVLVVGYAYPAGKEDDYKGPALRKCEMERAAKAFIGKPFLYEHDDNKVMGKITNAAVDDVGRLMMCADIDISTELGIETVEKIMNKTLTKLSIGTLNRASVENGIHNIREKHMLHIAATDDPFMDGTDIKFIQNPDQAISQLNYLYELRRYNNKLKDVLYKAKDIDMTLVLPVEQQDKMNSEWKEKAEELAKKNEMLEKLISESKSEEADKKRKREEEALVPNVQSQVPSQPPSQENKDYTQVLDLIKNNFGDNPNIAKEILDSYFTEQKKKTEQEQGTALSFVKEQYETAKKQPNEFLMKNLQNASNAPTVAQPLVDFITVCNQNSKNSMKTYEERISVLQNSLKEKEDTLAHYGKTDHLRKDLGTGLPKERIEAPKPGKSDLDKSIFDMYNLFGGGGGIEKIDYDCLKKQKL